MKDFLSVVKELETDFKSQNETLNSYLEIGTSYFLGNELTKAITVFEKAIEEDPKNSGGWIGKSIAHLAQSDPNSINNVDIGDYLERANTNTYKEKISKYLDAITLFYAYQYSQAIKLYIDQTNIAIAEKKAAQVAAVVGLATAAAGGAVASSSKSLTGRFIGYSLLSAGAGVSIKKGFDSFQLENLAKSLYGNAIAQSILSIPLIKKCLEINESSKLKVKEQSQIVLDSWSDSVIQIFKNEKSSFIKSMEEIKVIDNFLDSNKRNEVIAKLDELVYFMDMIGLDKSAEFNKALEIKNAVANLTTKYSEDDLQMISKKRNRVRNTVIVICAGAFWIAGIIGEKSNTENEESGILLLVLLIGGFILNRYYVIKRKKIYKSAGIETFHMDINNIVNDFGSLKLDKNSIDFNLVGL